MKANETSVRVLGGDETSSTSEARSVQDSARERLKSGRNDPCPCGSGRKYKKCCLAGDESAVRQARVAREAKTGVHARSTVPAPRETTAAAPVDEPGLPREVRSRLDHLWEQFDALNSPTIAQMDEFLGELLALPPDATSWSDPWHKLAQHNHPDLPAVFRRIADTVAHTRKSGMAFFYWAAAEEFVRKGLSHLLPEVVAGFCRLDRHSYDADALVHLYDYLLAANFEAEALQLAEHFLPIERADGRLMPYAVPNTCVLIFELRIGLALRLQPGSGATAETLAQALRRDIEEEIDADVGHHAAGIICDPAPCSSWTRAHFELAMSDAEDSDRARQDWLRLYGMLTCVVREARQVSVERFAPGCAFRGLSLLLESIYRAREDTQTKRKKAPQGGNLLDYLHPSGIDRRIARTCDDLLGVNVPRARLLLHAHEMLLHFATRHRLIAAGAAAATQTELTRLQRVLE